MTPRQRVRVAMEMGVPDQVPVQCQMATGHILLNSGIDPVAEATDTTSYAACCRDDLARGCSNTAAPSSNSFFCQA